MKFQYVKPQRAPAYTRARHTDKAFLSAVEDMARQGLDDLNIAIGLKEKFGIGLSSVWFSTLKNQKDKNGNPTKRANLINEALARGRTWGRCKQFDIKK